MKRPGQRRKNKIKKPANGSFLLRICVLAVSGVAMLALLNMQAEISTRRQQVDALRRQNEAQRMVNKDLKRRIEAGLDDETVEALARERFGYAYPDEIIYIDISGS